MIGTAPESLSEGQTELLYRVKTAGIAGMHYTKLYPLADELEIGGESLRELFRKGLLITAGNFGIHADYLDTKRDEKPRPGVIHAGGWTIIDDQTAEGRDKIAEIMGPR